MELKLSVSIGATLQVKNAKGEWDWIKPEVGAELKLVEGEVQREFIQEQFDKLWENIVGPQFQSVVRELLQEQTPEQVEEATEEVTEVTTVETSVTDEDEYY